MKRINNINIRNFKQFKDSTSIDFAPLTIICGENQSGKSSIIQSLLTLKQSIENTENDNSLTLSGPYVWSGSYCNSTFNKNDSPITFGYTFDISGGDFSNLQIPNPKTVAISIEISSKNDICDTVNYISKYTISITTEDDRTMNISFTSNDYLSSNYTLTLKNFENQVVTDKDCICTFEGAQLVNVKTNSSLETLISDIIKLWFCITQLLFYFRHIKSSREMTNAAFGYRPINLDFEIQKCGSSSTAKEWISKFGFGNLEKIDDVWTIDKCPISRVGDGVKYSLPIICEGLSLNPDDTLALDYPEICLHPESQLTMADFLLSLARDGKNLIVETHSDHIINRILRRIIEDGKDQLLNDIVKIYFVEKIDGVSQLKEIKIDLIKGFVDAPEKFFTQYAY